MRVFKVWWISTALLTTLSGMASGDELPRAATPGFLAQFELLDMATVEAPVAARATTPPSETEVETLPPQLSIKVTGPDALVIHEAAPYQVTLVNPGPSTINNVEVHGELPTWVQRKSESTSAGRCRQQGQTLVWSLPRVSPHASESLTLQLVAREGRPFELAFAAKYPERTRAKRVTVRQPELDLQLTGEADMTSAVPSVMQLRVANVGSLPLQNVQLELLADRTPLQLQSIKQLPAGAVRHLNIRVQPVEAGRQTIRVVAKSDRVADSVSRHFHVKRGKLSLQIVSPDAMIAGRPTTVEVAVTNVGDAAISDSELSLHLPSGVAYAGGIEGAKEVEAGVTWQTGPIGIGETRTSAVLLSASRGGRQDLWVQSLTSDQRRTRVREAILAVGAPDLRLEVIDPVGPQVIGEPLEYTIRVSNPGTDTAHSAAVTVIVDDDCEIHDVTGTAAIDGQKIRFRPTSGIDPGEAVTYTVLANPTSAGIHEFRVIASSKLPEVRLAAQETTLVVDPSDVRVAAAGLLELSAQRPKQQPTLATPQAPVLR